VPRLALAALVMGAALFWLDRLFDPFLAGGVAERYVTLTVLVGTGCALYGVACFVTGAFALADIKTLLKRRARTAEPKE
jgi:putative peptidoglycan lipid II flippase